MKYKFQILFSIMKMQTKKVKYQLLHESVEDKLNNLIQTKLNCLKSKTNRISSSYCQQSQNLTSNKQLKNIGWMTPKHKQSYDKQYQKVKSPKISKVKMVAIKSRRTIKMAKSLNSSYANFQDFQHLSKSQILSKSKNPQFKQCIEQLESISNKIEVMKSTNISQAQISNWIVEYCKKQEPKLIKLFEKAKHIQNQNAFYDKQYMEKMMRKVEYKIGEDYQGNIQFVRKSQLENLNSHLERIYMDRSKIRVKQLKRDITQRLTHILAKNHFYQNEDYVLTTRKKPTEISNFLSDLSDLQTNNGGLRRVTALSRKRFELLSKAELSIDREINKFNSDFSQFQEKQELVTIL